MAVDVSHLSTKAVFKVRIPESENKTSSSTYLVNPDVTDEIIFDSMNSINSLMSLPAYAILKVVTSEIISK